MACKHHKEAVSRMVCGAYSEGARNEDNQDRYKITERGVALCDGVGSMDSGETFAELAAWKIQDRLKKGDRADSALQDASILLSDFQRRNGIHGGASGSAGSFNVDGSCSVCSLGDTRAFLVRDGELQSLGEPDIDVSGRLTRYLGSRQDRSEWRKPETVPRSVIADATLLLASDGVWKYLSEEDLIGICSRSGASPKEIAVELVRQAKSGFSPDDCTAVVCRSERLSDSGKG